MGRIILITGASSGIGALSAMDLAKDNQIIIHYCSSKKSAENVANLVQEHGGTPHLVKANLNSDEGCTKLFSFIEDKFGQLDILINNAGGLSKRHHAHEITWQLMEEIFLLNTFSVLRLTSLCIPLLQKGRLPCIINITSASIRSGAPTATVYAAAKAAVDSFTRGVAKELAPLIRVNAIAPGYIDTRFHDKITSKEELKGIAEITPLKMLGEPKHIVSTIKFLIENQFITGETLDINGGLFMR